MSFAQLPQVPTWDVIEVSKSRIFFVTPDLAHNLNDYVVVHILVGSQWKAVSQCCLGVVAILKFRRTSRKRRIRW